MSPEPLANPPEGKPVSNTSAVSVGTRIFADTADLGESPPLPHFPRSTGFLGRVSQGKSIVDHSEDISVDLPRLRKLDPLHSLGLDRQEYEPPHSRVALSILSMFLRNKTRGQEAFSQAAEICGNSLLGKELEAIAQNIVDGAGFADQIQAHPKLFGWMAGQFVLIGEKSGGIPASLERYLALREQLDTNRNAPMPARTTRYTRDFALIASEVFGMTGELDDALRIAASEQPKRFRKSVADVIVSIRDGLEVGDSFEGAGKTRLFSFKFDPLFIRSVRVGCKTGNLEKILRAFGSESWSLQRL